jgi:hypothetical protein
VQWSGELGYGVRAPEGGQSGLRDDAATGIREIRDVFSAHLDDFERAPDQRGVQGVLTRLRAHIALRKATIRIPGRPRRATVPPAPPPPIAEAAVSGGAVAGAAVTGGAAAEGTVAGGTVTGETAAGGTVAGDGPTTGGER